MLFTLPGARVNACGQGVAGIELPEKARGKLPVVIAVHGSGRGAPDYWQTPFYSRQRQIALEHGCLFAVVSNGTDTWGLDDGLYNLQRLLQYLSEQYEIREKVVLWATSAGGVLAHRLAFLCPERIAAVIGTFPVYDLAREFLVLPSCGKAWGAEEETAFLEKIAGKNPPEFVQGLKGIPFFLSHGDSDQAVPLEDHSQALARDLGCGVSLEVIPGGEHGTQDLRYLETMPPKALDYYWEMLQECK
jgi:pimeloyl-ACP methyl ester carboxylesterase